MYIYIYIYVYCGRAAAAAGGVLYALICICVLKWAQNHNNCIQYVYLREHLGHEMSSVKWMLLMLNTMLVMCEPQCPVNKLVNPPDSDRYYPSINGNLAFSMLDSVSAWCPNGQALSSSGWMTIDLKTQSTVMGVVMQGNKGASQYVTKVEIFSSNDGVTYSSSHGQYDVIGLATNNFKAQVLLSAQANTRYLKIQTITFIGFPCMRVGIIILEGCPCSVGYTGPAGGPCTACPANTYKTIEHLVCQDCPSNTRSAPGSIACKCSMGYTGADGSACTPCAAGTYKDNIGNSTCQSCPEFFHIIGGQLIMHATASRTAPVHQPRQRHRARARARRRPAQRGQFAGGALRAHRPVHAAHAGRRRRRRGRVAPRRGAWPAFEWRRQRGPLQPPRLRVRARAAGRGPRDVPAGLCALPGHGPLALRRQPRHASAH